ncbi:helix-turn-helix domain-containing protein [Vibrio sp. S12_S33]|uniref:helix-turn-helix domain-containing protein n=1 Tax=Vibrio sp. S12_S33 TaxID=2720223 RepID=UPI003FD58BE8
MHSDEERLLALAHFKGRRSRTQIAQFLKVSGTSVNKWVQTFQEEGLAGLQGKPRTGRAPFLTSVQRKQWGQRIKDKAHNTQGVRLTDALRSCKNLASKATQTPSMIYSTIWAFHG